MLSGERRHSEPGPHGKSLTYPSLCQNYFRNQVDGAARIRVSCLGSRVWGQDIDDGWGGLSSEGFIRTAQKQFY